MNVTLELSPEDARLLSDHLHRRIEGLDFELVRTDTRGLQRALVEELQRLRAIERRIADAIDVAGA